LVRPHWHSLFSDRRTLRTS